MASFSYFCQSKPQLVCIVFIFIANIFSLVSGNGCYTSIINFGDSLSDTGNLVELQQTIKPSSAFPPNGETYFNGPTGRFSDGRLMVDFFAQEFRLPLLPPYFRGDNGNKNEFLKGVNFAVAGATALDNKYLALKGIINPSTDVSLSVQLGLFRKLLPSICSSSSECNEFFKNSLILMGEIGGNDFNYALSQGFKTESLGELVPDVINAISSVTQELIKLGAVTILVPGNLPIGCLPVYLNRFRTSNQQDYDPSTGCLIWLNQLSQYYNEMLQKELNNIQTLYPTANIVYADLFQAAIPFYRSPMQFGFNNTYDACCGMGDSYNFNILPVCGVPGSKSCEDPSSYVSWDGIHFTEAAYRLISKALLDGSHTIPPLNIQCLW